MKSQLETALFFEEVRSSITLMQNHAVLNDQWTEVEIRPQARELVFRVIGDQNHSLNHSISLPEDIKILGGSKLYRFLSGSGNQGNLNKTKFEVNDDIYELSFKLGSGRFEISKNE